jgi:catechol 2,3-dioxygenase-like lactoylglutathione lyase family enzyme
MSFTLTLAVRDLEKTAEFYREVLELPVEWLLPAPQHPPVLLLLQGDAVILFRETAVLEARHPALFQHLHRLPLGQGMTVEFTVGNLRPLLRNIARLRLHTLYELEDEEFGRREVWLHDPDGYLVVLHQEKEQPA